MLLGIEGEPIRDTQAVGGQQQGKDEAVLTAAVELLLVAVGLRRAFLGVAARVGVLGVLALLTMHGRVDHEKVQAIRLVAGRPQKLVLSGREKGSGRGRTAEPAEQPASVADIVEDGARGRGDGTSAGGQKKRGDKE